MKKETIEKLFKRYIGILDNVVFNNNGYHLPEYLTNEIYSQVDDLFNEYENIEKIADYIGFSKKITKIIEKTIKNASEITTNSHIRKIGEIFANKSDLELIDYIINDIETRSKNCGNIPTTVPYFKKYDELAKKYGIKVFIENPESLVDNNSKNKKDNDANDYDVIRHGKFEFGLNPKEYSQFLNDTELTFTKEQLSLYFFNENLEKLCLCKNSVKNEIVRHAIHSQYPVGSEEYLKDISEHFDTISNFTDKHLFFLYEQRYIHGYEKESSSKKTFPWETDNDCFKALYSSVLSSCKRNMYDQIYSKEELIQCINETHKYLIDHGISSKYYNISKNALSQLDDELLIRIVNVYKKLLLNTDNINDKYLQTLFDTILLIPINEHETVRYSKENNEYEYNEEIYANILKNYYLQETNSSIIDIELLERITGSFKSQYKFNAFNIYCNSIKKKIKNLFEKIKK